MPCIATPIIDCESVSINIEASGIANISLVAFSTSPSLPGTYPITLDINNRTFQGFIVAHQVSIITNLPLSAMDCSDPIYQHQVTIQAISF